MGTTYKVVVHGLRGEKLTLDLCDTEEQMKSMTVLQLKEKIAEKFAQDGGEEGLRLIFTGKMLDGDDTLLSEYGIQHMSVIKMELRLRGGGGLQETTPPQNPAVQLREAPSCVQM